jgi:hypothetical protein
MNPIIQILSFLMDYLLKHGVNQNLFIFIIISIVLFFWLYKEIKRNTLNDKEAITSRLEKALEVYGNLESTINRYLKLKNEETEKQLFEQIGTSYSYISLEILKKLSSFTNTGDIDILKESLILIRKEVINIKIRHHEYVPHIDKNETVREVSYFLELFGRLIKPVILAFLAYSLTTLIITSVFLIAQQKTWQDKLTLAIDIFDILIIIMILGLSIEILLNGRFKETKWSFPLGAFTSLFLSMFSHGLFLKIIPIVILFCVTILFLIKEYRKDFLHTEAL